MNPFIKVIEIWTPTADRRKLHLADGVFGSNSQFETASRQTLFSYDEGLPGKAWSKGYPQIITDLEDSYFLRKQDAKNANLTSAIALPIFSGEFLLAVVVFLCGDNQYDAGAVELWSCDQENSESLCLVDGYYGSLHILEHISHRINFMKGEGLLGTVWEYNLPVIIGEPPSSAIFLRRANAENDGITMPFGIPFNYQHNESVLTFLSALDSPIANCCEIWVPERNHNYLFFHDGKNEMEGDLHKLYKDKKVERGQGLLGEVWLSGCPQITRNITNDLLMPKELASQYEAVLAIPIIDNGLLRSIVAIYF